MLPTVESFPDWYRGYAALVTESTIPEALRASREYRKQVLNNWPQAKATYRYAEGKWSVLEVMQHMIDTERIFTYRALAFARGEQTALPGYDHNAYVDVCQADDRAFEDVLKEIRVVRKSTLALFESFSDEQLAAAGSANGMPLGVAQLGVIIAGHERHHLNVLKERYLPS